MRTLVTPVHPIAPRLSLLTPHQPQTVQRRAPRRATFLRVLHLAYSWLLWGFFTLLIFGQALGAAWTSVTSSLHLYFGQDPSLGVYQALGANDAPFTDRSFICALRGRVYKPVQLQQALDSPSTVVVDTSGSAINGYRVIKRKGLMYDDSVVEGYANACERIASTMDAIFNRCGDLGYNVTRDGLRIVEDADSSTMKLIPNALPVIVMPFADNYIDSRYAIPGWDGSACMFRLGGAYEISSNSAMIFMAVDRSVREQKTAEWLGKPGGTWRNGWYDDLDGGTWYSDILSTANTSLGVGVREFDMELNVEHECSSNDTCGNGIWRTSWGSHLSTVDISKLITSVTILDSNHFGLFLFDAPVERSIESVYSLEMILANVSLGALLFRWMLAKIAMLNIYRSGEVEFQSVGIGVLSSARGFLLLPLLLLPRLKTNLAVFATIGGTYDGAQLALAQAWFLMYPGIAELVFFTYGLLNWLAWLLQRRMSDALFGPTLIFFCAMHYARTNLAQSGWFEYDGRMPTIITSEQFERLSILDFFRDDTLLKLNSNIKSLFLIKVGVLSLNLLPLLFSQRTPRTEPTATETSLGLHLASGGGIGAVVASHSLRSAAPTAKGNKHERLPGISGYELLRLGYLVVGDAWLVSMYDWYLLMLTAPFSPWGLSSMRVMVFAVKREDDGQGGELHCIEKKPLLCRSNDLRLASCRPWAISARSFQ